MSKKWKYPNKLPRRTYWYHGTTLVDAKKILADGVIKPSWYAVWAANSKEWAFNFGATKCNVNLTFPDRREQMTQEELQVAEYVAVFRIPTKRLIYNKMSLSHDHSPAFYPGLVALQYHDEIPVTNDDLAVYKAQLKPELLQYVA